MSILPPIGGIEGGLSQAGRGAESGQGSGEDAHQHLNNSFPSFFFHVSQELGNCRIRLIREIRVRSFFEG